MLNFHASGTAISHAAIHAIPLSPMRTTAFCTPVRPPVVVTFVAVKRQYDQGNSQKREFTGACLQFQTHGHHGGKYGSREAGMVLDQYMRTYVLRRDQEEKRRNGGEGERLQIALALKPQNSSPVAHLLHHGHTS